MLISFHHQQEHQSQREELVDTDMISRLLIHIHQDFPVLIYPNSITQITTDFEDLTRDFSTITEEATITNAEVNINTNVNITGEVSCNTLSTTGNASVGGSLFLGDTNLTEDIDGLLTLDANKRLIINRLTSASVITGENNCDYLNTTFQGKFGIPDSANDLTLSGTQINFNSASFISNSAGGNSGNHLVIFVNGTEYRIKLENAS